MTLVATLLACGISLNPCCYRVATVRIGHCLHDLLVWRPWHITFATMKQDAGLDGLYLIQYGPYYYQP